MKFATVYMEADLGNVEKNEVCAERYIKEAAENGAVVIALPEFFTTGFAVNWQIASSILASSKALEKMKAWAKKYQIAIGGSYLEYDAKAQNIYNTYSLVLATGEVYSHRKDIPTAAEAFFYTKGDEISCFETPIGKVGIAMCWEMIRYNTVKRMQGKVDFVLAGSCWWNFCKEDGEEVYRGLSSYNQKLAVEAPQKLAELLKVPVIHASHKGSFEGSSIFDPSKKANRPIVTKAQIISEKGDVLIQSQEKAGVFIADLSDLSEKDDLERKSTATVFEGVKDEANNDKQAISWIPQMPEPLLNGFYMLGEKYKEMYEKKTLPYVKEQYSSILN